ncbi:hypothetical protein Smp_106590 [Schistosoma mansoni]|uniref:Uncharacterized protein n=1 Tax=Schistosoma mansoni TaxID=6183 RepID=G4VA69_SCHMA|nr:hypothetical protein Smp_106590 [Schistosoma mansoni]|eukprot:XP_018648284.1 hypothetical protein Smp_106590 [Schistosoma mansoni]
MLLTIGVVYVNGNSLYLVKPYLLILEYIMCISVWKFEL